MDTADDGNGVPDDDESANGSPLLEIVIGAVITLAGLVTVSLFVLGVRFWWSVFLVGLGIALLVRRRSDPRMTIAVAVLVLLVGGLLFAVSVYPYSWETPEESFDRANHTKYFVSGTVTIDGEVDTEFEAVVTEEAILVTETWAPETTDELAKRQLYQSGTGVYTRVVDKNGSAASDHMNQRGGSVLNQTMTDRGFESIILSPAPTQTAWDHLDSLEEDFLQHLQRLNYERTGDSDTLSTFEPQSGWYRTTSPYRITRANGSVQVDAAAGTVVSAAVDYRLTRARSYPTYVANDAHHVEVSFSIQPGDQTVERPDWMDRDDVPTVD